MLKTILKVSLVSTLLIVAQACTLGTNSAPTPDTISTSIAQTMAVLTQTPQPGIPITGGGTSTPTLTALPTTNSSPIPAFTATTAVVQVSVYVATNCRTGPSVAYPRVGGLQVGQVAHVVGRNADNTYWVIQNPGQTNQTCWLWGQFATLTGDITALPVITPPPPPPTATPTSIPLVTSTSATTPVSPAPSITSTP